MSLYPTSIIFVPSIDTHILYEIPDSMVNMHYCMLILKHTIFQCPELNWGTEWANTNYSSCSHSTVINTIFLQIIEGIVVKRCGNGDITQIEQLVADNNRIVNNRAVLELRGWRSPSDGCRGAAQN